jgi:hypothetical protein
MLNYQPISGGQFRQVVVGKHGASVVVKAGGCVALHMDFSQ